MGQDLMGNPVYRISFTTGNPPRLAMKTLAMNNLGELWKPILTPNRDATPQLADEAKNLRMAKGRWLNWIADPNNAMSSNERENFTRLINSWTGSAQELQDSMRIASLNLPFGATGEQQGGFGDTLSIGDLGGGGGGGGGAFGPQYRKPDRRVIEDFVTGTMVALAGTVLDDELDRIVDLYMTDHRRDFDSESSTIDPAQSVVEAIRSTQDYVVAHQDRPESADERTWISDRRTAAQRGGLTVSKQEDFAITQATVAGDLEDVESAASVAQLQSSGKAEGGLERKIRAVAEGVFSQVRR
jgi:hypothetical protein